MSAVPLVPGRAYRVRYQDRTVDVLAAGPVDALLCVLEMIGGRS